MCVEHKIPEILDMGFGVTPDTRANVIMMGDKKLREHNQKSLYNTNQEIPSSSSGHYSWFWHQK